MKKITKLLTNVLAALALAFTSRHPSAEGKKPPPRARLRPRCQGKQRDILARHAARMARVRHTEKLARLCAGNVIMAAAQLTRMQRRAATPGTKAHRNMRALAFGMACLALPACVTTGGGGITLDPIAGVCVRSTDGRYAVCANPLTKPVTYTVRLTTPGSAGWVMTYHSATDSWRADLPDGSAAIYKNGALTIEPALPSK